MECDIKTDLIVIPYSGKCKVPGANLGAVEILKEIQFEKKCWNINILSDFQNIEKIKKVNEKIYSLLEHNKIPIIIGGDHSTTAYIFHHILNTDYQYGCIIFDAHNDYANVEHDEFYNWNVINRIKDFLTEGIVIGCREHRSDMPQCSKMKYIEDSLWNLREESVKKIKELCKKNNFIYVSIDLDVLNPSEFPGTGYPCAGGIFLRELIYFIQIIKESAKNIIIDIVEFNPLIEKEQSLRVIKRLITEISL